MYNLTTKQIIYVLRVAFPLAQYECGVPEPVRLRLCRKALEGEVD